MLFNRKSILYSLGFMMIITIGSCSRKEIDTLDLSGVRAFKIDSPSLGIEEEWFRKEFDETVNLPGSMNSNGKGFDISLETKWTGSIFDSSFFTDPEYTPAARRSWSNPLNITFRRFFHFRSSLNHISLYCQ